mgnify:CR=1 FL=1
MQGEKWCSLQYYLILVFDIFQNPKFTPILIEELEYPLL